MSEPSANVTDASSRGRGRGRGKSRGGLGKYLRARGRGRGYGRPAEFGKRLLLEGEGPSDDEEAEEAAAEKIAKFSRRQLGTNADRYKEEEPELGSDGEPIIEPEVDLSRFLEKQRVTDAPDSLLDADHDDDDDVDTSLAHITSHTSRRTTAPSRKGKVEQVEWDEQLEFISRAKATAEATWDLKSRFKAKADKLAKPLVPSFGKLEPVRAEAPPLPLPEGMTRVVKDPMTEMEDFLDDLLK